MEGSSALETTNLSLANANEQFSSQTNILANIDEESTRKPGRNAIVASDSPLGTLDRMLDRNTSKSDEMKNSNDQTGEFERFENVELEKEERTAISFYSETS
ncbi:uncharacterized protein LOC124454273 [Xenia sp. Carnegie-2017]|uniref:uncharacterized protein LOC124454273 n=1 Tax=Xenia sp. Carnegie-2017 TaxID=2897299 RepID=UPI001F049785|nr:uncharacterized protein LOC124454273 [Xenia sp. Carnegie-2017]